MDTKAECSSVRFFLEVLAQCERKRIQLLLYAFGEGVFFSWIKTEKVAKSTTALPLGNMSAAAVAVSQQLSGIKVNVTTFVFYAILHCLCSTPSLFQRRYKNSFKKLHIKVTQYSKCAGLGGLDDESGQVSSPV